VAAAVAEVVVKAGHRSKVFTVFQEIMVMALVVETVQVAVAAVVLG
jgi:hypothetical protein